MASILSTLTTDDPTVMRLLNWLQKKTLRLLCRKIASTLARDILTVSNERNMHLLSYNV